jgi:LacI family transcriptional regulator
MDGMATIKDVARLAEVSTTSVSHVINGTRFVSDELRARIQAAMETLDYRPNVLARSLRRGETQTIGLIVPDNSNPFFAEVARTVEDVGFENEYSVILGNSDNSLDKETAYIRVLIAKQVDGVIFIAAGSDPEHLNELTKQGIPVVVADRDLPEALADVVLVNNEKGGYDATRYLLELGHQRIACISGPSDLTPSADRVRGYRRALQEAGIPVEEALIVPGDFRYQGGETAMDRLLRQSPPPSAVFCCNDLMAVGALRALRNVDRQVPGDVSLVGFDDIPFVSAVSPALTTIAQPIEELATLAAKLLIVRMQNTREERPGQRIVLDTKLVIRDSCAPV